MTEQRKECSRVDPCVGRTCMDRECEAIEDGEVVTGSEYHLVLDTECNEGTPDESWLLLDERYQLIACIEFCPQCGGRLV